MYPFTQPWTLLTLRKNILLKAVNSKLYTLSKTEGFLEQFASKKSKKNGGKKDFSFNVGGNMIVFPRFCSGLLKNQPKIVECSA